MQYLKKKCPKCGQQKLYDDFDGDGIDSTLEHWVACDNEDCEESYSLEELGVDVDGTFGFVLEEEYLCQKK